MKVASQPAHILILLNAVTWEGEGGEVGSCALLCICTGVGLNPSEKWSGNTINRTVCQHLAEAKVSTMQTL